MKHFVKSKIMGHFRSSEQQRKDAGQGSHTDRSQDSQAEVCPSPRPAPQRSCPGSQNVPEKMYVLKNCDRCQDYKVQPCNGNCKCRKKRAPCSGQCAASYQDRSSTHSQDSITEAVVPRTKLSEPSKSLDDLAPDRRMGGNCPICQFCGQEEIRQPGQNMCAQCNEKIQAAVDNYHVQCQGQCQPTAGQPCPYQQVRPQYQPQLQPAGQWQQLSGNPYENGQQHQGEQPFNIIVLQDCNNHSLIDQLTAAINRGGGQVHMPTEAQQSENKTYPNNYPNNYQNNPLSGFIDYEYVDPNRKEYGYEPERDDRYDYGYDVGPWRQDPYYQRDGYDDDGYQNYGSCNSYDCPAKNRANQNIESLGTSQADQPWNQSYDYGQSKSCTCSCQFCRKAFETKDKLALLIAQALEIFISNSNTKEEKKSEQTNKTKAKKKKVAKSMIPEPDEKSPPQSKQESAEHVANLPTKVTPRSKTMETPRSKTMETPRSKTMETPRSKTKETPRSKAKETPRSKAKETPQVKETQLGNEKSSKGKLSYQSTQSNKTISIQSSTPKVANHLGHQFKVAVAHSESSHDEDSMVSHNKTPSFFLPNCDEHRCKRNCNGLCSRKPHDCDKGCKSRCRGPCSKSGGGDGRSRRKGSKKQQRSNQRHSRCQQCNQGEGRQWQEVSANDCPAGTKTGNRNAGGSGGVGKNALLGLSPIAHYRPGMLQFPVNYLLAGTNFRRRLVRTAAGVTLHQKPYLDQADAKDLPSFPCRQKTSSPDCRAPVKKWL
ncbi:uncharacterized protein LOC117137424 isoform X1 [Drosophila mauritiana]|uniref:Uncharacterized protein LOC117137424 isoform X1 n=1 Tax=Drosophila mauritiana TaxID=7226 RepID=A0A6P8JGF1_DROMA|nr:uncharacterized protein LOC117137424 isoform X1 [Drosophila mauritiana]